MARLINSEEIDNITPKSNANNDNGSKLNKEISDRLQILFDSICHDILLKLDVSLYDIEARINKSSPSFNKKFEPAFNIIKTSALKYFQSFLNHNKSNLSLALDLDIFEQKCTKYKELIAKWTNDLYRLKSYLIDHSIKGLSKSIIEIFNMSGDDFELIIEKNDNNSDLFLVRSLKSNKSTPLKFNHDKLKEFEEKVSKTVSGLEKRLLFGFKLEEMPDSLTNIKFVHRDAQGLAIYEELGEKNIYTCKRKTLRKNPSFIKKFFKTATKENIKKICQLKGTLLFKLPDSKNSILVCDKFNSAFYIIDKDLSFVELLCTDKGFSYKSEYLHNLSTDSIIQSSSGPDIKIKSKLQLALRDHISSFIIKESLLNSDHEPYYNDSIYPNSEIPNRLKEDAQPKLKLSDTFYEFEAKCSTIYNSQYIPTAKSFATTPSTKRKIPVDYTANVDQTPSKQAKLHDSATSKPNCARAINFTAVQSHQDTKKLAKSNSKIIELLLQKKPDSSQLTEKYKEDLSVKADYLDLTVHQTPNPTEPKVDKTWVGESWEHNEDEMTIDNIIDDNDVWL